VNGHLRIVDEFHRHDRNREYERIKALPENDPERVRAEAILARVTDAIFPSAGLDEPEGTVLEMQPQGKADGEDFDDGPVAA
jgi:hypothetical protein